MTSTSWRDDFTRVLKHRAIAYEQQPDGFHTLMPFENVHGNGGLLTTVGDLLKWNENFVSPRVGDASLVRLQQQPVRFNDDRAHSYAFGLIVDEYKGVREVAHSGSTAGYSAYLARYPEQHASVAVLCNVATSATSFAHEVAEVYLANHLRPVAAPKAAHTLSAAETAAIVGMYKDTATGRPLRIQKDGDGFTAQPGGVLIPRSAVSFVTASGQQWEFDRRGGVRVADQFGTIDHFSRVAQARPSTELRALSGTYVSDEAEAVITVEADDNGLVLKRRPDTRIALTPLYPDAFTGSIGLVIFRRGSSGEPDGFSVVQERVWDMRFKKQ
jgi:hypothetical protein